MSRRFRAERPSSTLQPSAHSGVYLRRCKSPKPVSRWMSSAVFGGSNGAGGADVHADEEMALQWAVKNGHTDTITVLNEWMAREIEKPAEGSETT